MKSAGIIFRYVLTVLSAFVLCGCQMGYIVQSGYHQMGLLIKKKNFERALVDPRIDENTKRKIRLVQEVKKFTEEKMAMPKTRNYDSFVLLDDRYVVYAVTASYKDRLEPYLWSFPIVGKVPYKGYFKKSGAEEEKLELEKQNLDVMQRGVSAYSTLGWFSDPLLSSMTSNEDDWLVETIIHELTHVAVYIKSNADFNEQLATFVGNKGMEQFYFQKQGASSPAILKAKQVAEDSNTFSQFIGQEVKALEDFYAKNKNSPTLLQDREQQFSKIKNNFEQGCKPKLKTDSYKYFSQQKLNNAVLIGYKTYYQDLDAFEKAYQKVGGDWNAFMKFFDSIKKLEDPWKNLKEFNMTPK
ncbi:MAG: aminopeptidase [Oligoflexia bacterium]|nr:aminopeptidase [Oligoflexia bacterium]